ncbi:hypothetical protein MYC06_003113 [Vibrio parahaemolyticus]|nr:hypothetical protein [Vibrio parahaemolyticus]EGR2742820.1 hypothetical protein [Vibrio parahaemolyticus]EGR2874037.1 hypothetical protein [Vibrio parahaemolyticus]EJC7065359.1 hypothetical protein [Vibrio parahaemolyticus]EJG0501208.1 hypothetical protein [Vibrio parahaemolyticus]
MTKMNRRKYVYKNPKLNLVKSRLNDGLNPNVDLNSFYDYLISDCEALLKANSLTVDEQQNRIKPNASFSNKKSANCILSSQYHIKTDRLQSAQSNQTQKESRVPGLYGCNRYKSKRKEQVKESEMFCFF